MHRRIPWHRRRARATLAGALLLAACAAPPEPEAAAPPSYRDPSVTISSKAVLDTRRMDGTWQVVEAYPAAPGASCRPEGFDFAPDRLTITCTAGSAQRSLDGNLSYRGLGRYAATFAPGSGLPEALWVLWADEGYRTAVIGTPSGSGGWILDRRAGSSPDRLNAAREVLAFNGYAPLTRSAP